MAQISRPFQVVLVAFVLFAVAWFAVIHRSGGGSSTGSSAPGAAPSAAASSASGSSRAGAAHARAAHAGAAHAGTRASAHSTRASAHSGRRALVAPSVHRARVTAHTHAKAATPAHGKTAPPASAARGKAPGHAVHAAKAAHAALHSAGGANSGANATAAATLHNLTSALHLPALLKLLDVFVPSATVKVEHAEAVLIARMRSDLQPASQATVAGELHHGKTVLLLFLNPHSYDDDASAIATVEVAHKLRHSVAAHLALADQVNSFGTVTRDIQVYQTPTLLIVNPKRQVTTLTGLTDEFALEQAISEAKAGA